MAAKELYDFLSNETPDVAYTLALSPQSIINDLGTKNDLIHQGDDDSEERNEITSNFVFYINIRYDRLSDQDTGNIFDMFFNNSKANGMLNTFKFDHPDGHTYVVRFDTDLARQVFPSPNKHGIRSIRLKVLGRIAD